MSFLLNTLRRLLPKLQIALIIAILAVPQPAFSGGADDSSPHLIAAAQSSEIAAEASLETGLEASLETGLEMGLETGRRTFTFTNWGGPGLPVWTYVPSGIDKATAPIAFIMHGAGRDPQRYRDEWISGADKGGFIVIAPEFSDEDFPGPRSYNWGGVFGAETGEPRVRALWTFSAIEPMFDEVVARLGGGQTEYTLYGHSAGSQFVHRFMFFQPDARVKRFIPANAGWYTFPDLTVPFPFGLDGTVTSEDQLRAVLAKDVVVLLGDRDNDTEHSSLNRSAGAMAQGPHRFARGQAFYAAAEQLAASKGWEFGWSLRVVDGVAHSNGGMARGAYDLIE
jgi:hypothetical protein